MRRRLWHVTVVASGVLAGVASALAAEFRQTIEPVTISYEGPSTRANKQFLYSRGTPLEVVVQIEGWVKVRDAQGALTWVERRALGERTQVQVITPLAEVLAAPDPAAAVLYRAEAGLLLTLVAPPSGRYAQVRHRDGTTGFIRTDALFGL
ncbi:MAG: SH3 domain-containing protein [Casimicrobiaceae bacterium]|nr:SH3 domain-containing protein [Casimicrobiaceae bacterium]MDW8312711.1 SH3 domain-containing protein [Burkholderiales bacterium]